MEFNRNHCFAIGLIVLFLGIQFRLVESYRLNAESSRFIAEKLQKKSANPVTNMLAIPVTGSQRTLEPPRWLGWALVSVGAVLVLHSLAMKKPGG